MKIVVDARMLDHGGIGTYLKQLIPHLKASDNDWVFLTPESCRAKIYSPREQLQLPFSIPKCDLFWSPHFNIPLLPIRAKKRVVTLHDLFHLDHLDSLPTAQKLYAKLFLKKAVSTADEIITVSEFSKDRLLFFFKEAKGKVRVIPSGCNHLEEEQEVGGLPSSFFLTVGNLKPHKNLEIVLEALKQLPHAHLVHVGKANGAFQQERVHLLGQVNDKELAYLYRRAKALVFPSLYEGWGLPPLEAMHLSCPVIASRAASIPEACGSSALYFDPTDAAELARCMQTIDRSRVEKGRERANTFKWEKSANAHLQVFEKVVSNLP